MLKLSNLLLIGSTGRNSGKTEFACEVIRRVAPETAVTAVKVTTVREANGECPRGGGGCGACSDLDDDFLLWEETDPATGKDTSRLLAAGAQRVLWLRVLEGALEKGLRALCESTEPGTMVVCESNSLRKQVRPGLFVMVETASGVAPKPSAQAVLHLADRVVRSDGESFDVEPAAVHATAEGWKLREDATAIVLAGGESRRMRRDKTMLQVGGKPMIQHVCERLEGHFSHLMISANDPEKFEFLGLPVVPDREPGKGPLMGIASCLEVTKTRLNLVIACDIPRVEISLAHRMLALARDYDAVVPVTSDGLFEPLFGVYRRSVLPVIHRLLDEGERRTRRLFDRCRTCTLELPAGMELGNLNTMKDYLAHVEEPEAF